MGGPDQTPEGGWPDEVVGVGLQDDLHPVAGAGDLAGDTGCRERSGARPDRVEDQGREDLGRALVLASRGVAAEGGARTGCDVHEVLAARGVHLLSPLPEPNLELVLTQLFDGDT